MTGRRDWNERAISYVLIEMTEWKLPVIIVLVTVIFIFCHSLSLFRRGSLVLIVSIKILSFRLFPFIFG